MLKRIVTVACAMSLVGCATTKTNELTHNESGSFDGKTLVHTKYNDTPDFYAQTAANAQFGLIGAAKANSAGNSMIKKNGIQDPAIEVAQELAARYNLAPPVIPDYTGMEGDNIYG